MSRGHQTGQARIATTVGLDDLQRIARQEFNRAGSNRRYAVHIRPAFMSLALDSPSAKLHSEIDSRESVTIDAYACTSC